MVNFSLVFFIFCLWVVSDQVNCKDHHRAHAPAPSVDCASLMLNMAECLSFVSSGSNTSKPKGECCNGLKTVLKTDPACLCEGLKNSGKYGVDVNITKAMTLPSACHLKAPPISSCAMSVAPGAAPAQSPIQVASPAPAPSGGTTQVPAAAPTESDSSTTSISLVASLVGLVVASVSYF